MWNIIRHELRWNYKGSLIWALALSAATYLMMSLFPSIAQQHAKWDKLIGQLPKGLLAGFGMNQLQISNIYGYYGTQIYTLLVIVVAVYAVMLFSALLSREESEGTIEFLIAKPVSRSDIFYGKVISGVVLVVIVNAILFFVTWASFIEFHTDSYSLGVLVWFSIGLLLVTVTFSGLGLLLSVYLPRRRTLNSITIGIALISYFVGIASAMSTHLRVLRFLSPYQFVDAPSIVRYSSVPTGDWVGLLVVTALMVGWAYIFYRSKDIVV